MSVTRRELFRFAGAATAGLVFSPLPWKLLDDIAIWTQTGPWIPKVPRGPITTRLTACALCPAGCGAVARCIGAVPTSLRGADRHPMSHGTLCAVGFAGHHMAYHPLRVPGPVRVSSDESTVKTSPMPLDDVLNSVKNAAETGDGTVMILDQRPGRSLSLQYRAFIGRRTSGYYVTPDDDLALSSAALRTQGITAAHAAYDLDSARTILSLGSPLLDGWTTPARITRLLDRRRGPETVRVYAADPRRTRTAMLADWWLPFRPGTDRTFILGLAHLVSTVKRTQLPPAVEQLLRGFTPDIVSRTTGLSEQDLHHLAEELSRRGPSVVVAGGDGSGTLDADTHQAVAALNVIVGATDRVGVIRERPALPLPKGLRETDLAPRSGLADVPSESVSLVLLDGEEGSTPVAWSGIKRVLRPDGVVLSLSPYLNSLSGHSRYILPSPAPYEASAELTGDPTDPVPALSIGRALHARRPGSIDPTLILRHLDPASVPSEPVLMGRLGAMIADGRGTVTNFADGSAKRVEEFGSAAGLYAALQEGSVWTGSSNPVGRRSDGVLFGGDVKLISRLARPEEALTPEPGGVVALPVAWAAGSSSGRLSPLMTKVVQESELQPAGNAAFISEETARSLGLADHEAAELRTAAGHVSVTVSVKNGVAPGTVLLAAGPAPVGMPPNPGFHTASAAFTPGEQSPVRGLSAELRKA